MATVYGFLEEHGLEGEVKVNIEVGHAVLAGHSFEHEVALANALGPEPRSGRQEWLSSSHPISENLRY